MIEYGVKINLEIVRMKVIEKATILSIIVINNRPLPVDNLSKCIQRRIPYENRF
jgi:hypothetical protein